MLGERERQGWKEGKQRKLPISTTKVKMKSKSFEIEEASGEMKTFFERNVTIQNTSIYLQQVFVNVLTNKDTGFKNKIWKKSENEFYKFLKVHMYRIISD